MSYKELEEKGNSVINQNLLTIRSVDGVNYKPHPFTIRAKHISRYKIDTTIPCAFPKCNLLYDEHTFDKVVFLQLKQNITPEVFQTQVKLIVENLPENSFDGFCFVETEEKFRVI